MSNTADEFDLWAGESGFKSDFDGLVTDGYFTKDQKYNNGETLVLSLEVLADDGEEIVNFYPCGPDWDSFDNGASAEHPKDGKSDGGRLKTFNHQTAMFGLMSHATGSGAEEVLRKRGNPRNAAVWKGLKFHWVAETKTINFKDRDGNPVERQTTRVWPEKFLGEFEIDGDAAKKSGESEQGQTSASTTETSASSNAPPVAPAGGTASSNGNWDEVMAMIPVADSAKMKVLAKAKPYSDWIDQVLAIPGVTENEILLDAIGQEAFYLSLK